MQKENGKTALVVGMAKSGVGAAKLLRHLGYRVIVNDRKAEIPGLSEQLEGIECVMRLGEEPDGLLEGVDLIVPSPVIPMTRQFILDAKAKGIEVISEIELGWRNARADFVCITGTNGKTTSTALTGEMFRMGGFRTFVLGNIGVAITEHALETKPGDVVVAETAALQLEGCVDFHARAAACCNVTEDHLDHFGTMENYIANKRKVYMNQTPGDHAVFNYDDPIVRAMEKDTPAEPLFFSRKAEPDSGMFLRGSRVMYRRNGKEADFIGADEIRIPGGHNLENAMMSSLLALSMGVDPDAVRRALREFPGVEHRIEFTRELDGVRWFNDSKGTNPDSTIRAIETMKQPTVLILGGYDKHADFHPLFRAFGGKVRAIVVLGQTKEQILREAAECGYDGIVRTAETFRETLDTCRELARPGDAVLLSPACASWGMFDNYEQRGRIFKEIVRSYVPRTRG